MQNELSFRKPEPSKSRERDEVKEILIDKYRKIFVEKLTERDIEELQYFLHRQFTENRGINREYKFRFESKLREFFHEEILRREIVSIEVLINRLSPEDLRANRSGT